MEIQKLLIEFDKDGKIAKITVLVKISEHDIRAIQSDKKEGFGYFPIPEDATLSDELIDKVARRGYEVEAEKYFPK